MLGLAVAGRPSRADPRRPSYCWQKEDREESPRATPSAFPLRGGSLQQRRRSPPPPLAPPDAPGDDATRSTSMRRLILGPLAVCLLAACLASPPRGRADDAPAYAGTWKVTALLDVNEVSFWLL